MSLVGPYQVGNVPLSYPGHSTLCSESVESREIKRSQLRRVGTLRCRDVRKRTRPTRDIGTPRRVGAPILSR